MNELEATLALGADKAEALMKALTVESETELGMRSKVSVEARGDKLRLNISASDLSALRAAVNTYFRWVIACSELVEVN